MNKTELISKLENARSWKETGLTTDDVLNVLKSDTGNDTSAEMEELMQENTNLRDTIKKLRKENREIKKK